MKQSNAHVMSSTASKSLVSRSSDSAAVSSNTMPHGRKRSGSDKSIRSIARFFVSIVVTVILVTMMFYWAKAYSNRPPPPPSRRAQFQANTLVRITVHDGTSVSTYGDCPGTYWRGILGVATDGQDGQIIKRKACDDEWWYLVVIPELVDTEWQGTGWIEEKSLQPR